MDKGTKLGLKVAGFILLGGVVIIILMLVSFELMHRTEKAQKAAKVFAVSYEQFVDNWNNSDDSFTNGVNIDKSIDYNYEIALANNDVLQCEHITNSDDYDLTYKKNNASEQDYENVLISIYKLIGANVSDDELKHQVSDFKKDETVSVSIGVSNNKYLMCFISKYRTDGDLRVDTETGYATIDMTYDKFKSNLIKEYAQYLAGNDGKVTDSFKKEAEDIINQQLVTYENVSCEHWHSKVTSYEFDFARVGKWGSVHTKVQVAPETSTLVYLWVSCTNYRLNEYFQDCCRMITKAADGYPSIISKNFEYNSKKDLYEYKSMGVTYTSMSKSGVYSRMEIYPSEDYEFENEKEFTRINAEKQIDSPNPSTKNTNVSVKENNRTYFDCYEDNFSLILPDDWTYEIMDNQVVFYEKYNYKNFIEDTNSGNLGCIFTCSENDVYDYSPNAIILKTKGELTYAFSPPMGMGISNDEKANKKLKHALDETDSVTDSFKFAE